MATIETTELPKTPNIKYIRRNGKGWFCSGDTSEDGDLSSCTSAEDTIYDRGFGG